MHPFKTYDIMGSRSTFEFPNRVNLSGPLALWTELAGATRYKQSDFMLNIGCFTKGADFRDIKFFSTAYHFCFLKQDFYGLI